MSFLIEDVELHYYTDQELVSRLAKALETGDIKEWKEYLQKDIQDRLDGRCFCSAYSKSECLCGAWD